MNVNRIASCTVLALAVATIAAAAGIFMVHSTPIVIALIIITAIGTALSIAAVKSWHSLKDTETDDPTQSYFKNMSTYIGLSIAGVSQFFVQGIVLAAARGATQAVSANTSGAVANFLGTL
ncbi:MAG: hypothetical protein ACD_17C00036G0002 [uncultured bacterium]|nr:MAG: hypothetical protein ACD_17C00036G0002 [uncultured bacterium]OGN56873.1 MAG: hypothetical protein A2796_06795 [Chlamydiae bacterium RIFCSPHIGHO2_01_FULL_44_39]OGN59531.1 MAG: hypothetical protein A3D96_07485 [Chlamydiae bacterium RIFCSPHIGHO2_12_FULL_44_59]OGN67276.1 MAG: hypothetical protein A2978_03315 [Chlamydiae bacterium RIFCSPLOWO2_01_FULL_44_52]OGN68698.1 MAG: hypothetical protein A3I67_03045 [Chlamydiae bacterium RIFCSPLOWO2_02_FULL_45_22]OGN69219.1 MAG: hypothetical protein A3